MTFVNAVKTGFRNALVFSGRSRRPEYWWFFLFAFAGAFVISIIEAMLLGAGSHLLTRLFQLVVFVPFLAVAMRRLQDTGKPGWWILPPTAVVIITAIVAGSVMRRAVAGVIDRPAGVSDADLVAASVSPALLGGLLLAQVLAGALIIWWMTRPSQRGANVYGPEPRVRGTKS